MRTFTCISVISSCNLKSVWRTSCSFQKGQSCRTTLQVGNWLEFKSLWFEFDLLLPSSHHPVYDCLQYAIGQLMVDVLLMGGHSPSVTTILLLLQIHNEKMEMVIPPSSSVCTVHFETADKYHRPFSLPPPLSLPLSPSPLFHFPPSPSLFSFPFPLSPPPPSPQMSMMPTLSSRSPMRLLCSPLGRQ